MPEGFGLTEATSNRGVGSCAVRGSAVMTPTIIRVRQVISTSGSDSDSSTLNGRSVYFEPRLLKSHGTKHRELTALMEPSDKTGFSHVVHETDLRDVAIIRKRRTRSTRGVRHRLGEDVGDRACPSKGAQSKAMHLARPLGLVSGTCAGRS